MTPFFFRGAKCGGRWKGGYTVFHIPVEIEKRLKLVDYGPYKKLGEVVYVKEAKISTDQLTCTEFDIINR